MEELTKWEKEYINDHLNLRIRTDNYCYTDNPDIAKEDVAFLLEIIKRLTSPSHG